MDHLHLQTLQRRSRLKYEFSRLRRALIGFSPALLIVVATLLGTHRPIVAAFGAVMFATGVLVLWHGRDVRRAVLPGLALGVLPLTLAICASHFHSCSAAECTTWCASACTLGGLGAGAGAAVIGHRMQRSSGYWIAISAMTLLTGAMGSSCVGYAGLVGLAAGYMVGVAPEFVRAFFARKAT